MAEPHAGRVEERIADSGDDGGQDFLAGSAARFVKLLDHDWRDGRMLAEAQRPTSGAHADWKKRFDVPPTTARTFARTDDLVVIDEIYSNDAKMSAIACTRRVIAAPASNTSPKMIARCTPVWTISPGPSSAVAT